MVIGRFWRSWQFIVVMTVAVVILFGAIWWENINRDPGDLPPAPMVVLPTPNAFDFYVKAGGQVREGKEWKITANPKVLFLKSVTVRADADRIHQANRPAMATLRQGVAYEYRIPPKDSERYSYSVRYHSLLRILAFETAYALAQGQVDDALTPALDAIQLGTDAPRGGSTTTVWLGTMIEAPSRKFLSPYVNKVSATAARRAVARLEQIAARRPTFTDAVQIEKENGLRNWLILLRGGNAVYLSQQLARYTQDTGFSGAPPASELLTAQMYPFLHSKRQILSDLARNCDRWIAYTRQRYTVRVGDPPAQSPTAIFLSAPEMMHHWHEQVDATAKDALLTTALALQAYHAERGTYPATLQELVAAGILHHVPEDPFGKTERDLLHYRRVNTSGSANTGGYELYSVGENGVDDGCRMDDLLVSATPTAIHGPE